MTIKPTHQMMLFTIGSFWLAERRDDAPDA